MGCVIAAKVALIIPEMINSVVMYGQVLKELAFNEEAYIALETCDNKNLNYIEVKDSGHFPSAKGMDVIINDGFDFFNTLLIK